MIREAAVVLSIVCSAGVALADEATARKNFDEGERAYNLGKFPEAVELFKQAYDQWPEPAFLFNVAQTYRQMGDCKNALFFYKRFLALKERDTKKPLRPELKSEVEKRIVELDECVKRELAEKPPTQLESGGASTTGAGATTTGPTTATGGVGAEGEVDEGEVDEGEGEGDGETPATSQPTMMSARILAGAAKLGMGDLDTPIQFAGGLIGGYPLSLGPKLLLELGAGFSFSPVPYTTDDNQSGTGSLIAVFANIAPSYEVIPKLAVRADVGVGVQLFSGLGMEMNPFTEGGAAASGALTVLHVRAALSADYAINPNLVVTATPIAFGYSPAPDGFLSSISSLTTLSFMAGVGYRR